MCEKRILVVYNLMLPEFFLAEYSYLKYGGFGIAPKYFTTIYRFISPAHFLIVSVQNKSVYMCVYEDWKQFQAFILINLLLPSFLGSV